MLYFFKDKIIKIGNVKVDFIVKIIKQICIIMYIINIFDVFNMMVIG